jgi:ParB family chromosome partitioning protein
MGRFNLNQILSDTSKAAAGGGSAKPRPSESRYEKLSVFDLVPSEDNFYSMREIGELKAAIEIAGKVLQNLVVVPLGDGKYKVIAGHRRRLASIELVNDGKPEYEFVPCVIEPTEEAADEQEIRDGLDLIVTNSQREKTAWDKIEEVRYLREVLEKAKTKPRFVELLRRIVEKTFEDGELQTDGTRDFIAKVLHTSTTQIGRYDTIIRHLSPEFTEELKADRINISTAYELAGLPAENQNAAFKEYHLTGAISIKAAREWKRPAPPAPPAENTTTPTQAERPQKEREPVVERDKVPDTQAPPPYSAAVERDTADGT